MHNPNSYKLRNTFEVDAKLILQLGRDSIKDHTTALVELVKNGYDAGASIVEVEVNFNSTPKFIRIADNGIGMTEKEIDNNWLRIGYSEKKKNTKINGRRKTGEKGIGRIAADRIGTNLRMITESKKDGVKGIEIDWTAFEVENESLEKIKLKEIKKPEINLPPSSNSSITNTGTELIITGVRDIWNISTIAKLYNELSYFTPLINPDDFQIILKTDLSSKYDNIRVETSILEAAEIELDLIYDGKKDIVYNFRNRVNKEKSKLNDISLNQFIQNKEFSNLKCGPVEIKLFFFLRTAASLKGTDFKLSTVRKYLDTNFGVKLYRDNVVVKPYGYPDSPFGQDWLELDKRKAQDPAGLRRRSYKINASNLIGFVYFTRDYNPKLIDSSGREGLIENDYFYDLKGLIEGSVTLLENFRYELYKEIERDNVKENYEPVEESIKRIKKTLNSVIADIVAVRTFVKNKGDYSGKALDDTIKDAENALSEIEDTIEELLDEKRVMGGLATLGISSALFAHEIQIPVDRITQALNNLNNNLESREVNIPKALEKVIRIRKNINIVENWANFILQRVKKEKRVKVERPINKIVKEVLEQMDSMFDFLGIEVDASKIERLVAKTYPMDIESILINLITNAYSAIPNSDRKRRIKIQLINKYSAEDKKGLELIVSDSGPGIAQEYLDKIWDPFWSNKIGDKGRQIGIGLGLTIVKSIVTELKGTVKVEKDEELGGAKFIIWLPRK